MAGGLRSGSGGAVVLPCHVVWLDPAGKEHARQMDLSFLKRDKGWRMGE